MIEIGDRWLIKTKSLPSSIPKAFRCLWTYSIADSGHAYLWLPTHSFWLSVASSHVGLSDSPLYLRAYTDSIFYLHRANNHVLPFFFSLCLSQANVTSSSELKNSSFCCSFTFLALVVGPLFLPSIGMVSCNPLKDTNCNFSIISSGSVYLFDHKNCAWLMDELYKY